MSTLPRLNRSTQHSRSIVQAFSIDPIHFTCLVVLFSLALVTGWFAWSMNYKQSLVPLGEKTPSQWVEQPTYLSIDQSQHILTYLHADHLKHYDTPAMMLFDHPHFISHNETNQTTWELTAQEGKSPHLSETIYFKGHIILKKFIKEKEQFTLHAEQLTFHPKQKLIHIQTPGTVYYKSGAVKFTTFTANLENNTVKLDNATDITYQAIQR